MKWLGVGKGQTSVLSKARWDGESIIDCDGGLYEKKIYLFLFVFLSLKFLLK